MSKAGSLSHVLQGSFADARKLFSGIKSAKDSRELTKSFKDLAKNYTVRSLVEEHYVIPTFLKLDKATFTPVHKLKANNSLITEKFTQLEAYTANPQRFETKKTRFSETLEEVLQLAEKNIHIQEHDIIPKLEKGLSAERLDELGNDVEYVLAAGSHEAKYQDGPLFLGNEWVHEFNLRPEVTKEERNRRESERALEEKISGVERDIQQLQKAL